MLESENGNMGSVLKNSGGKKLKKRKELDALIGRVRAESGTGECNDPDRDGVSHGDQYLSEFIGENSNTAYPRRNLYCGSHEKQTRAFTALLRMGTILLIITCLLVSITVTWMLVDIKEQTASLRGQLDEVSAGHDIIPEPIQISHLLLKENQTKIENRLQRVTQRLANFYYQISGMQTVLSKVERKLDNFPLQKLIPDEQQRVNTIIKDFKIVMMEMHSIASSIVNQQSEAEKEIKTMIANVSSFNNNLLELKKLIPVTPLSDQSGEDDLVNMIKGKIHPEIQAFNTTMFSRVKWLSYQIQNAQNTASILKDDLEHSKRIIKKNLSDLKLQIFDINTSRSVINKWKKSIEETKILELKLAELLKRSFGINVLNEDSAKDPSVLPSRPEIFKSSTNTIPDVV